MSEKTVSRLRRARKSRSKMRELGVTRLCFYKSNQHLYAQLISPFAGGDKVLCTLSTKQADFAQVRKNLAGAEALGSAVAEKAKAEGIEKVAFDRSGFRYHGRVKQFAEAARKGGLAF